MFRYILLCGCLMAVAQAGIITGGLITGVPVAAQQTLTIKPGASSLALPAIAAASIRPVGLINQGWAGAGSLGLSSGLIGVNKGGLIGLNGIGGLGGIGGVGIGGLGGVGLGGW